MRDGWVVGLVFRVNDREKVDYIKSRIVEFGGEVVYTTVTRPPTRLIITKYQPLGLGNGGIRDERI
ncbi:MAG: hypothetical protein QXW58_05635 [Thermosphaera sp.]